MPTISEIEAERAKILEEIENRAKQKAQSGAPEGEAGHSLKDWLKAAQEIMPQVDDKTLITPANSPQFENSAYNANAGLTDRDNDSMDSSLDENPPTSFSAAMRANMNGSRVMPEQPSPSNLSNATKDHSETMNHSNPTSNISVNSKGFSLSALLLQVSLFFIFAIVLYFGYRTMTQEMALIREENRQQIQALREDLSKGELGAESEKTIAEMDKRIQFLESQLSLIQQQLADISQRPQQQIDFSKFNQLSENDQDRIRQGLSINTGISEEVLDEKLRTHNEQLANRLEKRIDHKLQPILQKLSMTAKKTPVTIAAPEEDELIAQPKAPEAPNMKTPKMQQPLLQMVSPKEQEKTASTMDKAEKLFNQTKQQLQTAKEQPKTSQEISSVQTVTEPEITRPEIQGIAQADLDWVSQQTASHYTLQLASMKKAEDLQRIIKKHQLTNTHVLPQIRNNNVNYILIYQSVMNRSEAEKLSADIKKQTGISPWIRKIQDVQKKVK